MSSQKKSNKENVDLKQYDIRLNCNSSRDAVSKIEYTHSSDESVIDHVCHSPELSLKKIAFKNNMIIIIIIINKYIPEIE